MRYSELLEYKRDITATNLGKQLIDRLDKEPTIRGDVGSIVRDVLNPRFPDSTYNYTLETGVAAILKLFEDVDPTPNKQYTEWLVRRYVDGSIVRFEDVLSTWADLLNEFHRLKTRRLLPPELMDINKFKTEQDLKQLHTSVRDIFDSTDEKAKVQKGESTEILNDANFRIIIPHDQEASCYYGQGTQWCTASRNNNMFNDYSVDGEPLFVVIPKNPEYQGQKFQLHFCTSQFMDETDSPMSLVNMDLDDYRKVFAKYDNCAKYALEFHTGVNIDKMVDDVMQMLINDKESLIKDGADEQAINDLIEMHKHKLLASNAIDALYRMNEQDESIQVTLSELLTELANQAEVGGGSLWDYFYDNIGIKVDDNFNIKVFRT